MESDNTQTVATFTGTLLKRQRMPGKPFVQLIFREAEKDWLCLSSNLKHVASLQIGKKYQIEGVFKTLGEHQYIHEPNIMPIAREIKKRRVLISLGLGLGIILAAGGIVLAATHDPSAPPRDTSADNTAQHTTTTNDTSAGTPTTTPDTPPTTPAPTTTPATMPTPKPTPKPKTTSTPAPAVTPPTDTTNSQNQTQSQQPQPQPQPPAAPATFTATAKSDGTGIDLSWSPSDGATQYQITRTDDNTSLGPVDGTTYALSDTKGPFTPGQTYHYSIVAVNAQGSSAPNTTSAVVPTPPAS